MAADPLRQLPGGALALRLHVQPRASRSEIAGMHGEALKLRLAAPPVDGKANKALIAFLAKLFGLPKTAVTMQSGHQGREKCCIVVGIAEAEARKRLGLS